MKDDQKWLKKWRTSIASTKFAHFCVVSVRKYMVQKYLISDRFDLLDRFFPRFLIIPYELFHSFFLNWRVKNESVILLSQNGKNELLKGANTCTYRL